MKYLVYSSYGKLMGEPFNTYASARAYADQLMEDSQEDTFFYVEEVIK